MIQAIEPLASLPKYKGRLNPTLLVTFYNMQLNDAQIATRMGITRQGVSDYKIRHRAEIEPFVYNHSLYTAVDAAMLAQKARNRLHDIVDTCEDFTKKDIIPLVAISDRLSTQSRLYSGESTENIHSKHSLDDTIDDLDKRQRELEVKLKEC